MSQVSEKLREIATRIEEEYKEETIKFRSQNMDYGELRPYLIEKCDGNPRDISVRGERLSSDEITIKGKWILHGGRRKGVFRTPDGKFWKVRGADGDAYDTSSMWFQESSETEVLEKVKKRIGAE
jgi:hypothetical protein